MVNAAARTHVAGSVQGPVGVHAADHLDLHQRLAGWGAALLAFLAASEPNLTLRFGPFIAAGVFLLSNPLRSRARATEWLLGAFLLWCILSQLWTTVPTSFFLKMLMIISLAATFVGLRAAILWGANCRLAVAAYILGCTYGLARTSIQLIGGSEIVYSDNFGRVTQVGDLNVNYVAYSTLTGIVLMLIALQGGQIRGRRARFWVIVSIGVLAAGAFSTQTRGVQVSLALIAFWLIVSRFGRPFKVVASLSLAAVLAVSLGWVDGYLATLEFGNRTESGLSGRLPLWASARESWSGSLFGGIGLGGDRAHNASNFATHNTILGLGMTTGLIGLLLFLAFVCRSQTDRLEDWSDWDRRFRLGLILLAFVPILLTSSWEWSASGWAGLALLSQPIVGRGARGGRSPGPVQSRRDGVVLG